jgi:hypothetical protein
VPEAERLPDILSEIAGGPEALIELGLHETGENRTTERQAPMKGSNRVCLLSAHLRLAVDVAKGGRILERRSGDL